MVLWRWISRREYTIVKSERLETNSPSNPTKKNKDNNNEKRNRKIIIIIIIPLATPPSSLPVGHSRTVIGVEQLGGSEGGIRLLVLDPSHSPAQVSQLLHTQTAPSALRLLRKPLSSMRAKQYQMVVVVGLMHTENEYKVSWGCGFGVCFRSYF